MSSETTPPRAPLLVRAGWCTFFGGSLVRKLNYRRLRFAYRAPSYLLAEMAATGHRIGYLGFDKELDSASLGHDRQACDILWVTTHGEFERAGYQFDLHVDDLALPGARLGFNGPKVLVLDTCDAVDLRNANWRRLWVEGVGPDLRLVLGFSTPATIGEITSRRGKAFAMRALRGEPLVDAWLKSAYHTTYPGLDHPIAFAIGDDADDARSVLESCTLTALPPARTGNNPVLVASRDRRSEQSP